MTKKDNDDYKKSLEESMYSKHQVFDRDILYVSCGALAISFSFVDKLVNIPHAQNKILLILGWLCFAISILNCLIATHSNIIRINKLTQKIGEEDEIDYWKQSNILMRGFRIASIALIAIGILFLFIFILH
jgi:hypothetical protein